jgi:hypothetical protein
MTAFLKEMIRAAINFHIRIINPFSGLKWDL